MFHVSTLFGAKVIRVLFEEVVDLSLSSIFESSATSKGACGDVVPIPTRPVRSMRILSVRTWLESTLVWKANSALAAASSRVACILAFVKLSLVLIPNSIPTPALLLASSFWILSG